MPYVDRNHITDENGNKLEYTVSYKKIDFVHVHREPIHVESDGHLNTENRNLVVKDTTLGSHAVSKSQLDNLDTQIKNNVTTVSNNLQSQFNTMIQQAINNLKSEITAQIQTSMKTLEAKILTQMHNFRNEQIKNRIQRKYLTIAKAVHKFLNILDKSDVGDDVTDLKNVIILNVWIQRYDRNHRAKSELVAEAFGSLEFFFTTKI